MRPALSASLRIITAAMAVYALGVATSWSILYVNSTYFPSIIADSPIATPTASPSMQPHNAQNQLYYIIGALFVTGGFALLARKARRLFDSFFSGLAARLYFAALVLYSSLVLSLFWLAALSGPGSLLPLLSIPIAAALALYFVFRDRLNNYLAAVMAIAAIGLLGLFLQPIEALALFIALSVWDYIAVFKLSFMQRLVGTAVSGWRGLALPMYIYTGHLGTIRRRLAGRPAFKAEGSMLLGLGDLIIPGILIASMAVYMGAFAAQLAFIGIVAGLYLDLYLVRQRRRALPALPIMCVGAAIALLFAIM